MKRELTCIGCPMGCRITAELTNGAVTDVQGNTCNVGKKYAVEELTCPKRMLTALVRVADSAAPLCVKTREPVEKARLFECLRALRAVEVRRPVQIGEVVLADICGTGVDVVATKSI